MQPTSLPLQKPGNRSWTGLQQMPFRLLATAREGRARAEERLAAAQERRKDAEARIAEALNCAPHEAMKLTGLGPE